MLIQYLSRSSFLITTQSGTRIVTDPLDSSSYNGALRYKPFNEPADIVTISHDHKDHNGVNVVKNTPIIIKGNGKFVANDVEFLGVATYHDRVQGAERGKNTVFVIYADDLRIAHMGDLGHVLNSDQAAEIGAVDIALVPVGGYYTINAEEAAKVVNQINAKIVMPMHYKTEKCDFPIAGVEEFIRGKSNVKWQGSTTLKVSKDSLPQEQQIIVLDYTL